MSRALLLSALYVSLALCALGLFWRGAGWFRVRIGPDARGVTPMQRVSALFGGTAAAFAGARAGGIIKAFFADVLLQRRLYAKGRLRWLGHLLIVAGFILLLLLHALAAVVTAKLFPGYESTRAPYLFLRNLFGFMVVAGMAMLYIGRWRANRGRPSARRPLDAAFAVLLGVVVATGFLLEADKIASPQAFYRMAKENSISDPAELEPLRALWGSEYGVAFADLPMPIAPDVLKKGRAVHEEGCESCHARPQSAFVSYPLARALSPVAGLLDAASAHTWLLYLHVFACFAGLASLPFTRFHHAVATPLSLLVNGAAPNRSFPVAGRASRRALALDACVHCGICDLRCSVGPLARHLGNPCLLPSHKLVATAALADGRLLAPERGGDVRRFAAGAYLCTDCGRCTADCPAGLDLEDLWQAGRGDLAVAGWPPLAQRISAQPAAREVRVPNSDVTHHGIAGPDVARAPLAADRASFSRCVQCQTCTNVCPVVAHGAGPGYGVDLTPQKVMNLLRLGQADLALGSRMVRDCATCYACQEHCPEGIRVADIMIELRALAAQRSGALSAEGRS